MLFIDIGNQEREIEIEREIEREEEEEEVMNQNVKLSYGIFNCPPCVKTYDYDKPIAIKVNLFGFRKKCILLIDCEHCQ